MKVLLAWCACCLTLGSAGHAFGADATADDAQRRHGLATERAAAHTRYEAAVRACQGTFAVTGCTNEAKSERRIALDRIAREEAALDDAQRRRRAEERRQRIAQKQQASAARAAASAPDVRLRAPRQLAPAASAPPRPSRRAEPRSAQAAAAEGAAAKERASQAQQRRDRAAAHAEEVRRRDRERDARKPPAAPLPVPPASAP